jgi:hypothetical protein
MRAAERLGARPQIRLSELSIFNLPPKHRIMAVIKGYFDDSRSDGRMWTVAGYVGNDDQWSRFQTAWPVVLAKHGVPYFHMNELNSPTGVYKKWHPLNTHQVEVDNFYQGLSRVIGFCVLNGFLFVRS